MNVISFIKQGEKPIGQEAGWISKIRLRFVEVKPVKHNIG